MLRCAIVLTYPLDSVIRGVGVCSALGECARAVRCWLGVASRRVPSAVRCASFTLMVELQGLNESDRGYGLSMGAHEMARAVSAGGDTSTSNVWGLDSDGDDAAASGLVVRQNTVAIVSSDSDESEGEHSSGKDAAPTAARPLSHSPSTVVTMYRCDNVNVAQAGPLSIGTVRRARRQHPQKQRRSHASGKAPVRDDGDGFDPEETALALQESRRMGSRRCRPPRSDAGAGPA